MGAKPGHRERKNLHRYRGNQWRPVDEQRTPDLAHLPPGVQDEDVLTLDLSGTRKDAQRSFDLYILSSRLWSYERGIRVDVTPLSGKTRHVFTTAEGDRTLYTVVKLDKDAITFVKKGRSYWFTGIYVDNQVFELKPDGGQEPYMDHDRHTTMSFSGNHWKISGGSPGSLPVGLPILRKTFRAMLTEKGRKNPQNWGVFTVHLCEAPRFEIVYQHMRTAIGEESFPLLLELYDWIDDLIHNWSKLSEFIMHYLNCLSKGDRLPTLSERNLAIGPLNTIEDAIDMVRVLQLDALNIDLFIHEKLQHVEKWTASAERAAGREITKKLKVNAVSRRQYKEAGGYVADSVSLSDDMFHKLNFQGEIRRLFVEKPALTAEKVNHVSWSSEGRSSIFFSKRNLSTECYDTKVSASKGLDFDIPVPKIMTANNMSKHTEHFCLYDRNPNCRRPILSHQPPKHTNLKGSITVQTGASLPRIRLATCILAGMHIMKSSAVCSRFSAVTKRTENRSIYLVKDHERRGHVVHSSGVIDGRGVGPEGRENAMLRGHVFHTSSAIDGRKASFFPREHRKRGHVVHSTGVIDGRGVGPEGRESSAMLRGHVFHTPSAIDGRKASFFPREHRKSMMLRGNVFHSPAANDGGASILNKVLLRLRGGRHTSFFPRELAERSR